jgi:putative transposase
MRAVCFVLGISRSHITALSTRKSDWVDRRKAPPKPDDVQLLEDIKNVAGKLATYGYRRVWGVLRHQGVDGSAPVVVNHKRVYRVMRDHSLLLYRHGHKPVDTRKHEGTVAVDTSNTRWCSDGFELSCDNGEKVRVAFSLDCCDREVMSWVATTKGIDAGLISDLMMQAVEYRFGSCSTAPKQIEWLTDNGSCYTSIHTQRFAKQLGLKPITTPVQSPQSNGMAESFVKTFKRDYARLAHRPDSQTVMRDLKLWFEHYNEKHPHSALGYLPPRKFKERQMLTN